MGTLTQARDGAEMAKWRASVLAIGQGHVSPRASVAGLSPERLGFPPCFLTLVFTSQSPCIYHVWVLRLFPLINCSYCFQFHDLADGWLNWWPAIFPGLSAPQRVLNIMGCDVQNWVLEPLRIPETMLLLSFLFFLYLIPPSKPFKSHRKWLIVRAH